MADGRKNNGGKRPNSGRKRKIEETGLVALLAKCATNKDRQDILVKLVEDCQSEDFHERHESRKLYLAYVYGKPTEKHEHSNPDGSPLLQPVAEALTKVYGNRPPSE